MNCRNALDILDLARPGSDDVFEPELAPAVRHVEACPDCEQTLALRGEMDQLIAAGMRDVTVPAGAKERLLAALEIDRRRQNGSAAALLEQPVPRAQAVEPSPAVSESSAADSNSVAESIAVAEPVTTEDPAPPPRPIPADRRRRVWIRVVAATAASLVAGVAAWWLLRPASADLLTLADLRRDVPLDLRRLAVFDGEFEAVLPGGSWRQVDVRFETPPRGYLQNNSGKHRIAVYTFRVSTEGGGDVRGALVVVSKDELADPPKQGHFAGISEAYAKRPGGLYETAAWSEGSLVYVCFVPIDRRGSRFDLLRRALFPPPA